MDVAQDRSFHTDPQLILFTVRYFRAEGIETEALTGSSMFKVQSSKTNAFQLGTLNLELGTLALANASGYDQAQSTSA
jgi:hypothetical protein